MKHENIQIRKNESCDQVFFMFTGIGQGLFLDPLVFFRTCKILDRNLVIFRQTENHYYMDGIGQEIDSFKKLLLWQESFLKQSPWIKKIYCIGSSAGGAAAAMSAHHLKADEVWSFAMAHPKAWIFSRGMGDFKRPRLLDPRRILKNSNEKTRYNFYFSENHVRDSKQSRRLEDCPGVHLFSMPGYKHNVMTSITEKGLLDTLLPPRTTEIDNKK